MKITKVALLVVLSAVAVVVVVGASAQSASAATPRFTVTASIGKRSVILDSAATVSATIRPGYKKQVAYLQTASHGKWVNLTKKRVSKHNVRFRVRPAAAGTASYRVYVGKHGNRRSAASPAVTVYVYRWHYISNLESVEINNNWMTGATEINGGTYVHSLFVIGFREGSSTDYNLGRKCLQLTGVAGMTDNSASGTSYDMAIDGDGNSLFERAASLGAGYAFNINVSSVLRLTFATAQTSNPDFDRTYLSFGNARVLCRF